MFGDKATKVLVYDRPIGLVVGLCLNNGFGSAIANVIRFCAKSLSRLGSDRRSLSLALPLSLTLSVTPSYGGPSPKNVGYMAHVRLALLQVEIVLGLGLKFILTDSALFAMGRPSNG